MIEIRNGATVYYVHLDRIHEWAHGSWQKLMYHLARGGEVNQEAAKTLAIWFLRALNTATRRYRDALYAYDTKHRDLRLTPRADREEQKQLNTALKEEVRLARRKCKSLETKYKHFLAAKAAMKKEN